MTPVAYPLAGVGGAAGVVLGALALAGTRAASEGWRLPPLQQAPLEVLGEVPCRGSTAQVLEQ